MRIFALSDIHVDYEVNARWIANISLADYRDDILILAGDVSHSLPLLDWCLSTLAARFRKLLFVPGNHDLWVLSEAQARNSLQKFDEVCAVAGASGASMQPFREQKLLIVPLMAWYDYSFGEPGEELKSMWMDYHACRWPSGFGEKEIAGHFAAFNKQQVSSADDMVITFSHFLPRIDLMPRFIPAKMNFLHPVLGTTQLELHLRSLNSEIHVYGHSHVNHKLKLDNVVYINNAFGYPNETRIASRRLLCIHEY
jgi:predicted phosphodiesterase